MTHFYGFLEYSVEVREILIPLIPNTKTVHNNTFFETNIVMTAYVASA